VRPAYVAAAAALLAAAAGALHASTEARAGHDALKKIVLEQCVPHAQRGQGPAPCAAVDLKDGSAVLKDIKGKTQFLLIPTKVVTGIDDPQILAADAPNYWQAAWEARKFVAERAGKLIPRDDIALAINSAYGRSQYQLHIHVDCVRADVKQALKTNLDRIGTAWADLNVDLQGHRYRAMRVESDDLSGRDPFRLLADNDPAARADMGRQTLAAVPVTFAGGKNGFVLLNDRANIAALDFASSSNLLDHDCAVLN
jgi:CDP-diacylglycerol pyrophosphatase